MIITEFYKTTKNGRTLIRTYSNQDKKIRKINTDEIYCEAIDFEENNFQYEELDIGIDEEE